MIKRRRPYIIFFLSIILMFLYVILFIFIFLKYDFASLLLAKFIHIFKNKELAEALFVTVFVVLPISAIYAIINRKPK